MTRVLFVGQQPETVDFMPKAPETTSGLLWPGAGHPTADRVRRS